MEILVTLGFIYLYLTNTLQNALYFVLIAGSLGLVYTYFYNREKILQSLITCIMIVVFASFTLIFNNPKIYMLKTTFSFSALGVTLIAWPLFTKKTLLEALVTEISCQRKTIYYLHYLSILFCLIAAVTNIYIVEYTDIVTWGKFKIALALVSALYTTIVLAILCKPWEKEDEQRKD